MLRDIADRAAALGAERFVLDGGWFGDRALSDWEVDARKYPEGLTPLIDDVHCLGMTFGIWFEPEMINPDSNVFRTNPHWALGGQDQILGRQQMALNMVLPEVREFQFERVGNLLRDNDIDYVKWDHNRVIPMPGADQTRGSHDLLERLRRAFPDVEIESCASGGARIDFGILSRTQRIWLSDSNDALERLKMQHNAASFCRWQSPAAMLAQGPAIRPGARWISGFALGSSRRGTWGLRWTRANFPTTKLRY